MRDVAAPPFDTPDLTENIVFGLSDEDLQHKFVEQVPVSYPLFTLRGNVPSFYRDIARYPAIFLIDRQGRLQPAQPRLSMGSGRQFFGITLAC